MADLFGSSRDKHIVENGVVKRTTVQQMMDQRKWSEEEVLRRFKVYEGECPCHP